MDLDRHVGSRHEARVKVGREHTVPALPIASATVAAMPEVLATPMLVAMAEHACIEHLAAVAPEAGFSLGAAVAIEHVAATPVGLTVTIATELTGVRGRLLDFAFTAHDGLDPIGGGRHTRALATRERFDARLAEKCARVE